MAKRGRTPSLIGGGAGASHFVTAKRKRTCHRCDGAIDRDTRCVEVAIPATMGHKTYCLNCYDEILTQTRADVQGLANELANLR